MVQTQWYVLAQLLLLILNFFGSKAYAAEVVSFYPTGSVKKVQQVTVRFSTDMVAMGDPRAKTDPFSITCNVLTKKNLTYGQQPSQTQQTPKYTTRWADSRNWVLDFEKPLNAGIRCTFNLKSDLKDLTGAKLQGLNEYSFSTAGPAILGMVPTYSNIQPDQYFVILVDGEIDLKSIKAIAYFEVEGIPDKVGVKIIEGQEREIVIRAALKDPWVWMNYRNLLEKNSQKPFSQIKEINKFIVLAAQRRFPDGARVAFHWPQGILSKTGLPVEEAQIFNFDVIKPFQAIFHCERANSNRPCNPISNMSVEFTYRLPSKTLKGAKLVSTDGKTWLPVELSNGNQDQRHQNKNLDEESEDQQVDKITFKAPFPELTQFKVILPSNLKDELGRNLTNQNKFPLEVATDEYLPLIKFPASFGILELKADPILPVSVRNIEKQIAIQQMALEAKSLNLSSQAKISEIISWYRTLKRNYLGYQKFPLLRKDQGTKFQIPKPLGEREFELVGLPLKEPGFYVVEIESPRLGQAFSLNGPTNRPLYVATGALVTNMSVHFKKGRESSLIWVTQLSDAKPVSDAQISLVDSSGKELAHGKTNQDGILHLGPVDFPCGAEGNGIERVHDYDSCTVYVFAQKGNDFSFTSSSWSEGIELNRFGVFPERLAKAWGPVVIHTVVDRVVAQPGDTIQMKHFLREYRQTGFVMMNEKHLPKRVLIVHQGSKKTYTLPFEFDKSTGTAIGKFTIPKDAALGRYEIYLSNKEQLPPKETEENDPFDWTAQNSGEFIVSEYRLPLMKAGIKIQGGPFVQPQSIKADLWAHFLSGGPAKGLKVKLRAMLKPVFSFTPIKPGIIDDENKFTDDENKFTKESFLKVEEIVLNSDGGYLATISPIPPSYDIQDLILEMEYTDPNGEIKTAHDAVRIYPADAFVHLESNSWYTTTGKTKLIGSITNVHYKPQSHRKYVVEAFLRKHTTHRKRLVGGFYSYDSKSEVKALGKVCEGESNELGQFQCEAQNLPAGEITFQAKAVDEKGRATYTTVSVSVYKAGTDVWRVPSESDSDRMDLLPERAFYEPGEKAKFIVRSPFTTSTILVTVEREGILDFFVTEIHRDNPVIEIPIKSHYAPNVYISALALRGRVAEPKPTALVDLARPAVKMGIAPISVGWKAHELLVDVKTDKTKYRARDKVQVAIQVKTALGAKLPEGSEVAVAAVDESLLRLKANTSWNILGAMMRRRGLAVSTSSGQIQVVGRRHFGSKAKPPGGGGGVLVADTRDLFEPVLLWQPRLKLDSNGQAKITVPLNDSITSFRIVAIASGGENFFGHGSATIESTKDLIIYSGFAPLVREGDQILNAFTLRNTTAKAMKVNLEISSKEITSLAKFPPIDLKPSEAKTLNLPIAVPIGIKELTFRIKAKDTVTQSEDILATKIKVEPAVPTSVLQATLFQLNKSHQIPVKQPSDAIAHKGGLRVDVRTTLVAGLAGVKSYMEDYPYDCLEQKISRAIVREDKNEIMHLIEILPSYMDGRGLLKFFPQSLFGSSQLTRYVMNILNENGYEIPQLTKTKLISGLSSTILGQRSSNQWEQSLYLQYSSELNILLMETLSRYKAFTPNFLSTVQLTPNLWNNETMIAWFQLLKRQADIPNRDAHLKQAENILRARVNFQGSLMNLQGDLNWQGRWSLFTSNDQEAIGVLGIAIDEASWGQDVGRMARGIVARLRDGHWDTTMANAWGLTQFRRFSAKFEKENISGQTRVSANDVNWILNWPSSPLGEKKLLGWPKDSDKNNVAVQFSHTGSGKPWVHFETLSAIQLKAPMDFGYKILRKVTPVNQASEGQWRVGDIANVELTITAKVDQPWVVVRDPIPAGASHLGTGFSGSFSILHLTQKPHIPSAEVENWPTEYEEKSHANFISYAAYLPKGTYRLNYRIRLNSSGEFKLPPTRVEAMYSPEIFGESPNANWKVSN